MLNKDTAAELLGQICECSGEIPVRCPACIVKEFVETFIKEADTIRELKTQNAWLKHSHTIHLDALNNYYHIIHKHCPCAKENGKCESPWHNQPR